MGTRGIVFGGSGFIGFHLLKHLAASRAHDKIISVDICAPQARIDGVEYVQHDLRQPVPVLLGEEGSTLYNLVAIRDFPGHPEREYYDVNVVSTQRIIDFAEATGARTIIFTSTMSIYGPGEEPKTEESPLAPVNPYGNSKRVAELLHEGWLHRNQDRKLVICRPAVIFGLYDRGNYTRLAGALRKGRFVYIGRKDTIKSAGYVGDLVRSFTFAGNHPQNYVVYNFAYPNADSIGAIVEKFCSVGSFKRPGMTLPIWLANLAAIPFEVLNKIGFRNPVDRDRLAKLYESTHIVPEWLMSNGFEFQTDLESALGEWRQDSQGKFV
nr:NAD(P)-dependent oxidoreductase [Rhizobium sp. TCK]